MPNTAAPEPPPARIARSLPGLPRFAVVAVASASFLLAAAGLAGLVAALFRIPATELEDLDKRASVGGFVLGAGGLVIGLAGLAVSVVALRAQRRPPQAEQEEAAGEDRAADPPGGDHVFLGGAFRAAATAAEVTEVKASGGRSVAFGRDNHGVLATGDITVAAPGPTLPPVADVDATGIVWLPRPVSPVFVGREHDLEALREALRNGPGVIAQAVVGLGGIGKSELALYYAARCEDAYDPVWWIDADSPERVQAGLAGLCRALCTGVASAAAAQAPVEEAAAWALAWLAGRDGWLVVFDNVEEIAHIQPYLGRLTAGHVLITSRRDTGWREMGAVLRLKVLEPSAAVELLRDLVPAAGWDEESAAELAAELGELPLALKQAGAYIAHTPGMSIPRYRHLLRTAPVKVLAAAGAGSGPAEQVVARTWAVTGRRIARADPLAVRLLRLLACYAPDQLPCTVLNGVEDADEFAVAEALGVLASYSMITPSVDRQSVSVHRLVQAVILAEMPGGKRSAVRAEAAALLEAALPDDPQRTSSWPAYARLLPHARAVLDPDTDAMGMVIDYLGASGDDSTACTLQHRRLLALSDRLGPEHTSTLFARHDLAYWTERVGNVAAARDMLAELLPVRERVLGAEHPDTLATRNQLANSIGEAGDVTGARDAFAELLPMDERVWGAEHPDTLTARHMLARWTGNAGEAAAARDMLAELLPVRDRTLGAEHPDTLSTRHDLAVWTGRAGEAAAARDAFAELLPVYERVLGAEHPDTLSTRNQLANSIGDAGDAPGARDMLAELLPVYERTLGAEHPSALHLRYDLAWWAGDAGDAAAARDMLAELLPVRDRTLGAEHPDTLNVRHDLAVWTGGAGDAAAARDMLAELLPVYERVRGHECPDTLGTRHDLAWWTGKAGEAAGARDMLAELLPVYERVLGAEHPGTLNTRDSLAVWTGEAGDAAGARDMLAELLPLRRRAHGPEHPAVLESWHELARWTGEAGEAAGARDMLAELLPLRRRVRGPEHPDTLDTRHQLADWRKKAEDRS
ncbi:tetratricopeptide repeat protein [Planomonospora venezuelensis]|uniref:DUF7779 domain-containing protein n=1 Tax=Planomonospora venezuelensis TaxID=1999 RepID=A0A841DEC4_PLAVE|nr:hypothetical protein [Planomonospora venezuelensis]GIN04854.1 hypothetical protein Pve01_65120 [Planomonospora venezuelensis]